MDGKRSQTVQGCGSGKPGVWEECVKVGVMKAPPPTHWVAPPWRTTQGHITTQNSPKYSYRKFVLLFIQSILKSWFVHLRLTVQEVRCVFCVFLKGLYFTFHPHVRCNFCVQGGMRRPAFHSRPAIGPRMYGMPPRANTRGSGGRDSNFVFSSSYKKERNTVPSAGREPKPGYSFPQRSVCKYRLFLRLKAN